MSDKLKIARLFWVLLVIVTLARWAMSLRHVPYDRGTAVSIVTTTLLSTVIFAAFARRWRVPWSRPTWAKSNASINWRSPKCTCSRETALASLSHKPKSRN